MRKDDAPAIPIDIGISSQLVPRKTKNMHMDSNEAMINEDAKIRFDATTGMIRALSLGIGLYHEVGACAARGRGTRAS